MDLADRIRTVEQLLHIRVCFHDLSGRLEPIVGSERIQHRHPYCAAMKRRLPAACTACDAHLCQEHLARQPDGFWKVCHGGLLELYLPIRADGALAGAAFIGVWRWTGRALPAAILRDPQNATRLDRWPSMPELSDPERLEQLFAVGRMLARDAEGELRAPASSVKDAHVDAIRAFIARRLTEDISLADVAAHLGLSASRTSAIIRQRLGSTMPHILRDARLAKARQLLSLTNLPVADVARRCGLHDPRYFHRLFRQVEGCTPEAWRQRGGA